MPATQVIRPVVRSFKARYLQEASAHVRAGGHAILWDDLGNSKTPTRSRIKSARLVFRAPKKGDTGDLGYWSVLDLGKSSFTIIRSGVLEGLAFLRVPKDCLDTVLRRIERDSIHPNATHKLKLDCLACGACCRDNRVILDDDDIERFRSAGREELAKAPYARREDGLVILRLRRDKRCKHLQDNNCCSIYKLRPEACSSFPMASECCLYAREEELGVYDGLPPGS